MKQNAIFTFSLLCYVLGAAVMGGYSFFLAQGPHLPAPEGFPAPGSLALNLGLIALFGLQHSLMARHGFKTLLTRHLPKAAERSTYVLFSSLALGLLMVAWQPTGPVLYDLRGSPFALVGWTLYAVGWTLCLVSTFQIDHLHLFGIRQALRAGTANPDGDSPFKIPILYRFVRHPLYLGMLLFHWALPFRTLDQVLLSTGMTLYIVIGVTFEEEDLLRTFGESYRRYQRQVPRILPLPRPKAQ